MAASSLRRWELAALVSAAVIVVAVPLSLLRAACRRRSGERRVGGGHLRRQRVVPRLSQGGVRQVEGLGPRARHGRRHRADRARGLRRRRRFTHRGHARPGSSGATAKFFVETEGPDGKPGEFEVKYTFGVRPLQQYLVPFPGGRLQCLTIAWDTREPAVVRALPGPGHPARRTGCTGRATRRTGTACAPSATRRTCRKGYDAETESFDTTWSEISVGCEACHGPGSRHVAWARVPPMARSSLDQRRPRRADVWHLVCAAGRTLRALSFAPRRARRLRPLGPAAARSSYCPRC